MRPLLWLTPLPLLAACAPATSSDTASRAALTVPAFDAVFSADGVAWIEAGRACVARVPSYRATCPRLPGPAVAVAWNDGDAWVALPGAGILLTLDRAARSVPVGRVVALSSTRAYREDGTAVTYAGQPARGVAGAPTAAVTGGDGEDYALVAGTLRRVADGAVVEVSPLPVLAATPTGAATFTLPTAATRVDRFRLTGEALQRLDASGRVLARVPHGPGRVGLVGADVVTVAPGGAVRVFGTDLEPVRR
ncbi:hypothetical protein F8S09_09180 [Deinococcus sp. SDU3-2]|uniref:Lipoprotein n=1 Tax=Deinococcus terrestris TaxID=2651870 RepID=A0A7X1NWP4_9DEIO|nr:hypothetical protein [Deinococcus terrestris]MPY66859.1 hypothetical protein [Deinococcus terrestris]